MKKHKGRFQKGSGSIGFQEWNLIDPQAFARLFQDLLREGFEYATAKYDCLAYFSTFSEEPDGDATVIHVELPIGPTDGDSPTWEFSLADMIEEIVTDIEEAADGFVKDPELCTNATAIRNDLRKLADQLDVALNKKIAK